MQIVQDRFVRASLSMYLAIGLASVRRTFLISTERDRILITAAVPPGAGQPRAALLVDARAWDEDAVALGAASDPPQPARS